MTHFERAVRENRVFLTQDTDFLALSSDMLAVGKLDRKKLRLLPVKDVYLYPRRRHFRKILASYN